MELEVLPRRDVAEAARPPLGHVGQGIELRHVEDALRDLDADHLRVGRLPLAIGAAHQPVRPPLVRRELAALEALERAHEVVDLRRVREGEPRPAEGLGIVECAMSSPPQTRSGRSASARGWGKSRGRDGRAGLDDVADHDGAGRVGIAIDRGRRAERVERADPRGARSVPAARQMAAGVAADQPREIRSLAMAAAGGRGPSGSRGSAIPAPPIPGRGDTRPRRGPTPPRSPRRGRDA